jgi:hypothetical protein
MSLGKEGSGAVEGVNRRVDGSGGDKLATSAVEEGKVTVVHPAVMERLGLSLAHCGEWWGLLDPLSCCRVGHMFVDEMGLEVVPAFE